MLDFTDKEINEHFEEVKKSVLKGVDGALDDVKEKYTKVIDDTINGKFNPEYIYFIKKAIDSYNTEIDKFLNGEIKRMEKCMKEKELE